MHEQKGGYKASMKWFFFFLVKKILSSLPGEGLPQDKVKLFQLHVYLVQLFKKENSLVMIHHEFIHKDYINRYTTE